MLRESLATKVESGGRARGGGRGPGLRRDPAETAVLKLHTTEDLATQPAAAGRRRGDARPAHEPALHRREHPLVVITSPDGSHGKTTVAFGLAATLARAGTKTLLVDADLRRGRVAELLELQRSPGPDGRPARRGPARGGGPPRQPTGSTCSSAGARSADPGELLTNEFPSLLARLEREYEAIVIDCHAGDPDQRREDRRPLRGRDAARRQGRLAPRRQVRAAVERLELISVKPTAAVLNYSSEVSRSNYYVQPDRGGRPDPPGGCRGNARAPLTARLSCSNGAEATAGRTRSSCSGCSRSSRGSGSVVLGAAWCRRRWRCCSCSAGAALLVFLAPHRSRDPARRRRPRPSRARSPRAARPGSASPSWPAASASPASRRVVRDKRRARLRARPGARARASSGSRSSRRSRRSDTAAAITTTTRYASFASIYVIFTPVRPDRVLQRRIAWTLDDLLLGRRGTRARAST